MITARRRGYALIYVLAALPLIVVVGTAAVQLTAPLHFFLIDHERICAVVHGRPGIEGVAPGAAPTDAPTAGQHPPEQVVAPASGI